MSGDKDKERKKGGESWSSTVMAAPDKKKFERDLSEISAKIKELEAQRKQLSSGGDQSVEINTELSRLTSDLAEIGQQKIRTTTEVRKLEEQVKNMGPEITNKKDEASKLLVGLRYKSKERIEDAVSKLRQQLMTRHYSTTEERKLQTEIDTLENSKEDLSQYLSTKADIDRMIEEQEQLRERRNSLYRVGRELRTREGETKDRQALLRKQMTELRDKKKDLQSQKDALTQEMDSLFKKRQRLRDEFRRAQSAYSSELSQRETEERERESKRRGQERIARRRKQVLEAEMWREMQYEEEKTTCKTLIAHLQKLMEGSTVTAECNGAVAGSGLKSDPQRSRSSPASTTAMPATASGRERSEFKQPGEFLPRKTDELSGYLVPTSSRRRSRRDKKRHAPSSSKAPRLLHYDPVVLAQFEFLSVSPPSTHSHVPHVLHTLQEKLAFYEHKAAVCSEAGDSGIGSQALGDVSSEQDLNSQEDSDQTSLSPNRRSLDPLPLSPDHASSRDDALSPSSSSLTPTLSTSDVKSLNHSISTSTNASSSSASALVQVTE